MADGRILVVDDEPQFLSTVQDFLENNGFEVIAGTSCRQAEEIYCSAKPDAAVMDYSLGDGNALDILPRLRAADASIPIIIMTGHASIELAVQAVKLGAEHFLTKPVDLVTLAVMLERSLENQRNRRKQAIDQSRSSRAGINPFLGTSDAIGRLEEMAGRVALADSPILIQGETGTGKNVLARWIHGQSGRAKEPFVDLNCGGLMRDFLETELFGHEKGAFTGAVQNKTGLLEIAHKGTLFLDEIGDVDISVQPKILKVLEEKQFRRLGDVRDRRVDIRLVAATHQNLNLLMKDKRFRTDLFFRISTIPLAVPPLRERVEDIPLLATHLVERLSAELSCGTVEIKPEAMRRLQSYSWPGNIREMRNVLERAVLLSGNRVIGEKNLHFDQTEWPELKLGNLSKTLEEMERDYIAQVLQAEGGRVETAARKLGIPRSTLYAKLKQYKLERCAQAASSSN
ncbi:MAG: sigma-54 dependent transcriptional regulator [Terriglobales bacterium]